MGEKGVESVICVCWYDRDDEGREIQFVCKNCSTLFESVVNDNG